MDKKWKVMVFVSALTLVFSACAWAEGDADEMNDTIDDMNNRTLTEATAFATNNGSKVRLLQLQKAIEKNILWGDSIIADVKAKNATANTTEAETILAELEALNREVASITPKAGDAGAKEFVDLKNDAIDLTKEFRDEIRKLLKEQEIQGMKKKLGERYWNETRELDEKIEQARNNYNAEVLEDVLAAANMSDPVLVAKVKAGQATTKEIKDALKEAYKNLNSSQKRIASIALKEKEAKRNVFMRSVADKVAENASKNAEKRIENRIKMAEKLSLPDAVKQKLHNREKVVDTRVLRIENRTRTMITKFEDKGNQQTVRSNGKAGKD